jgi:thioredoxin 1
MAIEVDRDTFEHEVIETNGLVLVDFWGPQCKPCMALMPQIDALESKYPGRLKIVKVDATYNRMLCAKLRVLGLPTILLYRHGLEVRRLTGAHINRVDIEAAIEASLI